MALIDYCCGIATPKLDIPDPPDLSFRLPAITWDICVSPFKNPVWSRILAIIPAILGALTIFAEQHIAAVIVNRRENKLKKGGGYHLDLFVLAIIIQICTIFGLPW